MRISDWSSDVCSSDLALVDPVDESAEESSGEDLESIEGDSSDETVEATDEAAAADEADQDAEDVVDSDVDADVSDEQSVDQAPEDPLEEFRRALWARSEEHTSELQSLMRISYAVFCLKKKTRQKTQCD